MSWATGRLLRTLLTLATMLVLLATAVWSVRDSAVVADATLKVLEDPDAGAASQVLLAEVVGDNVAKGVTGSGEVKAGLRDVSAGKDASRLRSAVFKVVVPGSEQALKLEPVLTALSSETRSDVTSKSPVPTVSRLGSLHPVRWLFANAETVLPVGAAIVAGGLGLLVLLAGGRRASVLRRVFRWGLWGGGVPLALLLVVLPVANLAWDHSGLVVASVFLPALFTKPVTLWAALVIGGGLGLAVPSLFPAVAGTVRRVLSSGQKRSRVSGQKQTQSAPGREQGPDSIRNSVPSQGPLRESVLLPPLRGGSEQVLPNDFQEPVGTGRYEEDDFPWALLNPYQRAQWQVCVRKLF